MKPLTEKHTKFINKKLHPMLDEMMDDHITFDDRKYKVQEIRDWLEQITDRGEYTTNEKRFLTGMTKLYQHLNE